ncbi:hypothetical protein DDB_G0280503 [Dictyostelium discoideum AX4]|uniref:Ubiquitin-like domain-containing protein n=1 Tax=Dictyostelium discoideum TaxID=44689 RepID=Q54V97_DICDI|nr:hypothetical protein DDB_G0280503 [Dictyostelium discoideum AX4]EAL67231.1 hypothetical protein DDB_G0280503 [Dictyostelium discoideum AX4]|eukprot:XP_641211.1 hypothetical protein DDB_G0280503 [Dictyostelium discoideum AX4]
MLILVKTSTITFSLDVQREDGIDVLYNKVAERSGQKVFQFSLIYAGDVLSNSTSKNTIGACGIKTESTVHMIIIKEFKLTIQYLDKSYPILVPNNEGLKISTLKFQIKNSLQEVIDGLESKSVNGIVLSKNEIELNNSSSLQSVLNNGDMVEMKLIEEIIIPPTTTTTTTTTTSSPSNYLEEKKRKEKEIQDENDRLLKSFIENNESITSDVEIMFCFDTTGSMYPIIENVRKEVTKTVKCLIKDIPNIKIGIMGLGDYCDGENLIKTLDLTSKESDIITFIKEIPRTSGGDCPEAYEYALLKAKQLSWSSHTSKAFVLIGDNVPHEPSYTNLNINWFKECDDLYNMGIKIYGVKAGTDSSVSCFYQEIAERTSGISIDFKNFDLITRLFLAICYRESSKTQFEKYKSDIKNDKDSNLSKILDDLNKDNYEVIKSDEIKKDNNNNNSSNNNNNNNNNNNDGASSSTNNEEKNKVIVRDYGKPINLKSSQKWFNHEIDINRKPQYIYSNSLKYFVFHTESKGSRCNLM